MARQLRIEYEDAVYHVLSRGNSRGRIFEDEKDYLLFLETLKESVETHGVVIICYVLMPNHYHFVIETPKANLSRFMKHFNITYTVRFNKKHKRSGHLFQGRFKSIIVEKDPYLLALSAYIHLNPIRTKYFEDKTLKEKLNYLTRYKWSTLPGYLNQNNRKGWIDYHKILSYFGKKSQGYLGYILEQIKNPPPNPFDKVKHQIVLGRDSFVKEIKGKFLERKEGRELPALKELRSLSSEQVIEEVCTFFKTKKEEITKARAKEGEIRQIAMDLCYKFTGLSQQEIGKIFGNVDYSTVSQGRRRLKLRMESNARLASSYEKINKILSELQSFAKINQL